MYRRSVLVLFAVVSAPSIGHADVPRAEAQLPIQTDLEPGNALLIRTGLAQGTENQGTGLLGALQLRYAPRPWLQLSATMYGTVSIGGEANAHNFAEMGSSGGVPSLGVDWVRSLRPDLRLGVSALAVVGGRDRSEADEASSIYLDDPTIAWPRAHQLLGQSQLRWVRPGWVVQGNLGLMELVGGDLPDPRTVFRGGAGVAAVLPGSRLSVGLEALVLSHVVDDEDIGTPDPEGDGDGPAGVLTFGARWRGRTWSGGGRVIITQGRAAVGADLGFAFH